MKIFDDLQAWYSAQCDGDWEHQYGVVIESMDNPGWWVKIDLRDTILENVSFPVLEVGDPNDDASWIACKVIGTQFHGAGDPSRLQEIIERFLAWAQEQPNWLAIPDDEAVRRRDDRELWEQLGKSYGAERCRVAGCEHWRVRHSVFCRVHHWEKVFGRPCPFREDAD